VRIDEYLEKLNLFQELTGHPALVPKRGDKRH